MQHNLKIEQKWLDAVVDGRKKAEVRRADRDFAVGDQLLLYVPSGADGALVTITHIVHLRDVRALGCSEAIAVLSIDTPRRMAGEKLAAQLEAGHYGESR
ncbi:MAG: DUF3850 domain-containing protein [Thermoleophilia bacterium]